MTTRYICSVLDEMRDCFKTHNFSYLMGLIEEAQVLANRMEAALYDNKNIEHLQGRNRELKETKRELKKEIAELRDKKEKLEEELEVIELKQGFVKKVEETAK